MLPIFIKKISASPYRQYVLIGALFLALAHFYFLGGHDGGNILLIIALIGSIETAIGAVQSVMEKKIGIDTFNIFAVIIAFSAGEVTSAAFIVLMLAFADLLEWKTESRAGNAIKELLALKPRLALRETLAGVLEEIEAANVGKGDTLVVKNGSVIPVDGVVISGKAEVNEASVTGESRLVMKVSGDTVLCGTINEVGFLKVKATRVGKDGTLDQMIRLVKEAAKNKSRNERLADRFAGIFLPIVVLLGLAVYLITGDLVMTGALFLIACADDMAVAIPMAVAAALGNAAKNGVIIKGGEWLDAISRVKTVVLDKTGTLTYGSVAVKLVSFEPNISEQTFWHAAGVAEKFSIHPIGKAVYREALKKLGEVPDPEDYRLVEGKGIRVRIVGEDILVGNMSMIYDHDIRLSEKSKTAFDEAGARGETAFFVIANKKVLGVVSVADVIRAEAKEAMEKLRALGIRVVMLTGDTEMVAKETAASLGIAEYRASLKPEDKLREIEKLLPIGSVCMVGDGINDAPALSRADVGIAMGSGGTAVAVEAADIVILNDDISKLPDMIDLGRRTSRVIKTDIVIWLLSNAVGFYLVFTGIAGLAFAAFYNFATDFLPLGNSVLFFRGVKKHGT
jgi:heavy metal translocating P-type ATPase